MQCPSCRLDVDTTARVCPHCNASLGPGRSFISIVTKLDAILAAMCLSAMVVIVLCQIVLRNFFQTGIEGADFLVRHLVLWVVFLGAGIASREKRHIHIDLLPRFLPKKIEQVTQILVALFSVIVLAILSYAAVTFVTMELESGITVPLLGLPIWIVESIIPLGYAIIAVHFLVNGILGLRGKHES